MTTTRLWTAGAVLVMAILVALGWFLGIDPRLAEARTAESDLAGVETLNATYEQKLVELKKVDSDLPALMKQLDALNAALPSDAQVSTLLGQLNSLAADSGVDLTSITAGAPSSETPASATPTAPGPAENFVSVPVSVEFTGDPGSLLAFIQKVQYGTRLFLVDALDITYDAGGGKVKMDGFVYVLTDAPAADASATSTAPVQGG